MKEQQSEGYCIYCNTLIPQKTMGKHLASHLAAREKAEAGENAVNFCHVEVEAGEFFLHLLVKGSAKMKVIDVFLRDIWLDCCDHMSAFGHRNFKVSMSYAVEDVMEPKIKIYHDYDFGSTTRVFLKGHKQYQLIQKGNVTLLSRNEPIEIACSKCKKKPAVNLCAVCTTDIDYTYYCKACSAVHEEECEDFADYSSMPVVNSPRMGVCGYEGGSIDVERDGAVRRVKS
ncbi:MAG: hypothetical protein K0B15_14670 [Lentimicrobium sp.]|nr:hypothetical protein [Lentimicrobium sp.]